MDMYEDLTCGDFIPYIENIGAFGNYDGDELSLPAFERNTSSRKGTVRREKWTEKQTHVLVQQWKENAFILESNYHSGIWLKIKCVVDQHGPPKSVTQCKEKLRSLKDAYEQARDNNNKMCASHLLCPYFSDFDEVLGTQDLGRKAFESFGFELPPSDSISLHPSDIGGVIPDDDPMDEDVENTPVPSIKEHEKEEGETEEAGMVFRQEFKSLQKAMINARKEHEERHDKFIRKLIGEQTNAPKDHYTRLGMFSK